MELLITYDVSTETKAGQKRLRHVAKTCQAFGQRVQKSVFECRVTETQWVDLRHRLETTIDHECDSLRIYRLREPYKTFVILVGKQPAYDIREPLII